MHPPQQTVQTSGSQTWNGAAAACDAQKARLADVNSREETNFVLSMTKGQGIFMGLKDAGGTGGKMATGYFRRWAGTTPPPPMAGTGEPQCATMRPDGSWGSTPCTSQMGTYVCQVTKGGRGQNQKNQPSALWTDNQPCKPDAYTHTRLYTTRPIITVPPLAQMRLTAPEATIHDVSGGEQFRFLPLNPATQQQQPIQWGVPVPVRIQHATSGAYLAMDLNGRVYQTFNATKDALFALETVPSTNAFLIQSLAYENMYLNFDDQTGGLRGGVANVNVTEYKPDSSVGGTDYISIAQATAVKRRRLEEEQQQWQQQQQQQDEQQQGGRGLQSANTQTGGTQGYMGTGGGGNYVLNGGQPSPTAPAASLAPALKYAELPATAFMASQLVSPLAIQNLQISVAVFRSDTMENPRLCTMFIYDLTPNSDSYTCYEVSRRKKGGGR